MSRRCPNDFADGQPVELETGLADDLGKVDRGARGKVLGENCVMPDDRGRQRVNVQLDDGQIVAVPHDAIRRRRA